MSAAAVSTNAKGGKGGTSSNHSRRQHHHSSSNNSSSSKSEVSDKKTHAQSQSQSHHHQQQQYLQKQLHPLNRRWTLWYDSPSTYNTENWELSLQPIMTVGTVEEFFVMLRYMKPLHDLRTSSQYHFFQEGVKPMWEDAANKEGGKIWVNVDIPNNSPPTNIIAPAAATTTTAAGGAEEKKSPMTPSGAAKSDLDQMWERVLMGLIGEYLEPSLDAQKKEGGSATPQIVGVVMAKRKYHNRLALWVGDARNTAAIETVKKKLKEEAALPASASLVFTKHGENGAKN